MADDLTGVFDAAMARLGPFEPRPRLAAAVSGGADSMALAVLTDSWVGRQGGSLLAIIIDHGLRREAAAEAAVTRERLSARGIAVQVCRLDGLAHGPALAERARQARFAALTRTCRDAGILHLLLGHHAGDQAETVMMRVLRGSGSRGLAGMAALQESDQLRLLRPLLDVAPGRLRAFLAAVGIGWVEDPSNRDVAALRPRLRLLRGDPSGEGEGTRAVCAAARSAGLRRAADDGAVAAVLAARVVFRPDGVALLSPGPIRPDALAAVIQTIAGAPYPADPAAVAALAARPRPATIGGVRLMPARRLTDGMLVVREAAAMSGPVPAEPGAVWDRRFRLAACGISQGPVADWAGAGQSDAGQSDAGQSDPDRADPRETDPRESDSRLALPGGKEPDQRSANCLTIGALGEESARLRRRSRLPAAALRTLPALWRGNALAVVPHLLYPDAATCAQVRLIFTPPRPAAGAPYLPG